jgi:hypothetical protein
LNLLDFLFIFLRLSLVAYLCGCWGPRFGSTCSEDTVLFRMCSCCLQFCPAHAVSALNVSGCILENVLRWWWSGIESRETTFWWVASHPPTLS